MDKKIYLDIVAQLKAEVPELKWIDMDEGQLNVENPPVAYPCALIEMEYPQCSDLGGDEQLCNVRVTFRFAFKPTGQTSSAAPVLLQDVALARWETVSKAYSAFQGWGTDEASSFSRISQTNERRRDNLKVIVQVWETSFEEEA